MSVVVVLLGLSGAAFAEAPCGAPDACYRRGVEAFKAKDGAAVAWFGAGCDGGHGESCAELAFLLMEGLLVARDDGRAVRVATRGCELGSGLACNNAFVLVRDGRGRDKDDGELRRLALRACALDDGEGCYLAAAVLGEPLGGELDEANAKVALDKSCKLGFGMACAVIAHRRLTGEGGEKADEVGGVKLMARACELGSGAACTLVGTWTANGEHGLREDREKALGIYRAACELGDDDGCKAKDDYLARTARGRLTGTLVRRSGKRVLMRKDDGDAPPAGAVATLSAEGTTLGEVTVKRVEGPTVELEVAQAKAPDAAWKAGVGLTLSWRRPDEPSAPTP